MQVTLKHHVDLHLSPPMPMHVEICHVASVVVCSKFI